MIEDEAFIRAIVDSPGDDTPRLVYADWLDDRSDPRGPYLRAELDFDHGSTPAGEKPLVGLGGAIDPIWRLRVTRPPFGVCCDHIHFVNSGPSLTLADLDEVKQWRRVRFPDDYVAFLLNYNGGVAGPVVGSKRPQSGPLLVTDAAFYTFHPRGDQFAGDDSLRVASLLEQITASVLDENKSWYDDEDIAWYHDTIPIADSGGSSSVMLGVHGPHRGRMQFLDWTGRPTPFEIGEAVQLGGSLAGFFAQIQPFPH